MPDLHIYSIPVGCAGRAPLVEGSGEIANRAIFRAVTPASKYRRNEASNQTSWP